MELEFLKQNISNYIEIRRNFWTALLGLTAGLSALIITLDSLPKIILLILGFLFLIADVFSIHLLNKEINKKVNKIKELKNAL